MIANALLGAVIGLLPLWGWAALLAGGAGFAWISSGRIAGIAATVAGALFLAGIAGYRMSESEHAAASLRARLATLQRDLDAARTAERDAGRRAAALVERDTRNQEILRDYETALAARSEPGACVLSGDDVRSLQRLR